jgi:hypothetical protein
MFIVEIIGKTKIFHKKKWGNWKKSCLVENIGKSENFHTQLINFEWPHDNTYPVIISWIASFSSWDVLCLLPV